MTAQSAGIPLQKKFGQHFLRDNGVVDRMVQRVALDSQSSVFEIGSGDGFLTREILKSPVTRLWVFEIDEMWVNYLRVNITDSRLQIFHENILDVDFSQFLDHKPWILLANLPYQITFPFLHLIQKHRSLMSEGVIMVQEEVAQKIVKTRGRGYGYSSLFFRYYFDWELMEKVPPTAFYPPPKVFSRLLYFRPKANPCPVPDEQQFWSFVKMLFRQPRRTIKNNLIQGHFNITCIPEKYYSLRAQQMSEQEIIQLWKLLYKTQKIKI